MTNEVELVIYNLIGQKIETLVSEHMEPSSYSVVWSGEINGLTASAGIYFYRLSSGGEEMIGKMTLLK